MLSELVQDQHAEQLAATAIIAATVPCDRTSTARGCGPFGGDYVRMMGIGDQGCTVSRCIREIDHLSRQGEGSGGRGAA